MREDDEGPVGTGDASIGIDGRLTRRRLLAAGASAVTLSTAGCTSLLSGSGSDESLSTFRGSGALVEGRPAPGGISIDDLPALSGSLRIYLGGGESGLYVDLLNLLSDVYDGFEFRYTRGAASDLANTIVEENRAATPQADLFLAVDAGSLGSVAQAGATEPIPQESLDLVGENFRDPQGRWVGFAGRARAVPFNTNRLSADDIPTSVREFPRFGPFQDDVGWAPTYGAFQTFVTAMRAIRGDDATRRWLRAMEEAGVSEYPDEWRVSNAVADGSVAGGLANHYYALRVLNAREDAPIDLAFTRNDAGSLVNVSGAEILAGTERPDLAGNLVRHLLSAEAQEFFATRTYAYPMISGVDPVGDLPTIDELHPPDVNLAELTDVDGTLDLLREAGVL
ncbi:MAG: extracellular solute-binding protein [Haloarculaceae archaeon]